LNLTTPFLLSQAFAHSVLAAGEDAASIINIASINSFQGEMEVPSYAASKHGILGLTRALANEWAPQRIRVNAITPGYMETEFTVAHRHRPVRRRWMAVPITPRPPLGGTLMASTPQKHPLVPADTELVASASNLRRNECEHFSRRKISGR
ncbi:SDR family NAD(P)-dependent oxidoreductase, partial [Rhodococcus wratislaviensis]|uniref:SDR family NAD(P)-dependent oxidoreductase n=1 Tax=Rhodococcus wratislaviensis TaxID=44752 RepID=UPI003647C848